jgi:pimeloyl-ACP methyl ester carboxylesterase
MSAMGDSYQKRGLRIHQEESRRRFLRPAVATPELIDEVYASINDRRKLIKTLTIAKVQFVTIWQRPHVRTCIIWGKMKVTPPDVAEEFKQLLPNSLYWIDKCGHAAMMEQRKSSIVCLKNG